MSTQVSQSELVTTLVIDGAIAMVAGTVQGKAPVEGVPLSKIERTKLGLADGGLTMFYPAGGEEGDGVFFDMAGDKATVWYNGGDSERALQTFEAALKKAHPKTRYLGDGENALNATMRSRTFEIDLSGGKIAVLDVAFAPPGSVGKRQFAVRVFAKKKSS